METRAISYTGSVSTGDQFLIRIVAAGRYHTLAFTRNGSLGQPVTTVLPADANSAAGRAGRVGWNRYRFFQDMPQLIP